MNLMKRTLGWVLLISGLTVTTGCAAVTAMTEEEDVTPEQIGLEVIARGGGSGPNSCSVNVDEVVAATHVVSVSAENGPAHVRILDRADRVVFEADSIGASEGSSGDESDGQPDMIAADEASGGSVRLVPGDYRVECAMGTSVSTASLHVIPASGSASE